MPTRYYNNLRRRIDQLERRLLPGISPIGSYTDEEYDLVRGYLLLCHAEIESYLESMAVKSAVGALDNWKSNKRVNLCIASLMLHHDSSKISGSSNMNTQIHLAVQNHVKYVKYNNHGIKEKNLFSMFVPLGLEKNEVSPILTAELDTLGSRRGTIAHTSARSVNTPPDPGSFRDQINIVVTELLSFDQVAASLRRR